MARLSRSSPELASDGKRSSCDSSACVSSSPPDVAAAQSVSNISKRTNPPPHISPEGDPPDQGDIPKGGMSGALAIGIGVYVFGMTIGWCGMAVALALWFRP